MKKTFLAVVLIAIFAVSLVACNNNATPSGDTYPAEDGERNALSIYSDGEDVSDAKTAYAKIKTKFAEKEINGVKYYAVTLKDLCAYDITSIKGVFVECTDGFIKYYATSEVANLYIVSFANENDAYKPIKLGDASTYGSIVADNKSSLISGVKNIHMVTTAPTFSVNIKVNGVDTGKTLTFSDFMKKTSDGDNKIATKFYEGSFKYAGGASTFTGQFLGIDYATFVKKLINDKGVDVTATAITNMKVKGYVAMPNNAVSYNNNIGTETSASIKMFSDMKFFVMFGGATKGASSVVNADREVGLSAFVSGAGLKWMTMNISEIDIITA